MRHRPQLQLCHGNAPQAAEMDPLLSTPSLLNPSLVFFLTRVSCMSLSPARRRNRIARQDRYRAEGTALPQKTTDAIKRLKDEATHNDLAEEARPGDAAWVKAICEMSLCTAVIIR